MNRAYRERERDRDRWLTLWDGSPGVQLVPNVAEVQDVVGDFHGTTESAREASVARQLPLLVGQVFVVLRRRHHVTQVGEVSANGDALAAAPQAHKHIFTTLHTPSPNSNQNKFKFTQAEGPKWFTTTAVWQLQPKVVQTVQQQCLVWIYLDTYRHVTIFNWMFTITCCLVVELGLGLGLGLDFFVWLVSCYVHVFVRL